MLGGVSFHIFRKDRQLDGQRIPYPQQDPCYTGAQHWDGKIENMTHY